MRLAAIFVPLSFVISAFAQPVGAQATQSGEPSEGDPLRLMTSLAWYGASDREHDIYVYGALEGWSFMMYGMLPPNDETRAASFSDFTMCAKSETASRFQEKGWLWGNHEDSMAHEIAKWASHVCEKYVGKGDRSRRPLRLVSKLDWDNNYSKTDRSTYVMGYIELLYDLLGRDVPQYAAEFRRDRVKLEKCIAAIGLEGVMREIEKRPIDGKDPMPWAISTAMGRVCKKFAPDASQ